MNTCPLCGGQLDKMVDRDTLTIYECENCYNGFDEHGQHIEDTQSVLAKHS